MNATEQQLPADLITASHASRIAKVHISGLLRWVRDGKLPGWNRLGRVYVRQADVLALFRPVEPPKPPPRRGRRPKRDRWADAELARHGL